MSVKRPVWTALVTAVAAVATALAVVPDAAATPAATNGTLQQSTYSTGSDVYPYLLYTPASVRGNRPVPLVVVAHGCQTTAAQQMEATRYNRIADRGGFVVLYPDVDAADRALPWPATNCWRFFDPGSWHRGGGESAAIAGMTRAAMGARAIDPQRVFLVGMSSGAFMASVMAATDPDLYAAVGIASGGEYADPTCLFGSPVSRPVEDSARAAYVEMGPRARVVPRLVVGGDADLGVPASCHEKALEQGVVTDNLVRARRGEKPASTAPAAVRREAAPGHDASTVLTYRDPDGCVIAQRWIVHGMGHYWSGGSPDPRWSAWTDPRGPDAAAISWDFFAHNTKRTCNSG